ncbi:PAS domain S-box protein [Aliiglaciecola litoralis]|uniref:histidine kinase n=1 Tax=Aliiglaciecola litoralis TaxID=582857 RepID=A0ABN1LRY0_9ALTE
MTNSESRISPDANAEFNALVNAAIDGIIIIDHRGNIELFNAAAETMFGYDAADVMGKNIKVLMPEPYQSEHDDYLQHYMDTGEKRVIGIGREVNARRKNGEIFPIELTVGEVKQSSHRQFVGIIRDITERVQLRSEAIVNRERLAHASRLTTMGELVAGIAHEINQPLTAISSYSQACRNMLSRAHDDDIKPEFNTDMARVLEKITDQAFRAGQVISRLRGFVSKRDPIRETVRLNSLIHDTIELAKVDTRILEHGIRLHLTKEPEPELTVDSIQLQQVLFNLINNAIDAMAEQHEQPVLIHSRWITNEMIEVAVIDRGHGVKKEHENTLFNPFFTTKEQGMGMGLTISQSIIAAHGGKLKHCHGIPDGSIFAIELPAKPYSSYIE